VAEERRIDATLACDGAAQKARHQDGAEQARRRDQVEQGQTEFQETDDKNVALRPAESLERVGRSLGAQELRGGGSGDEQGAEARQDSADHRHPAAPSFLFS
jgi:hypothetical protein